MKIHFIHGIHPSQPGGTVAKLVPYFNAGQTWGLYNLKVHEYGAAYAVTSRFLNPGRAEYISQSVDPGDVIIAHSNGCSITNLIGKYRTPGQVYLINPALDDDTEFSAGLGEIYVLYNSGDKAVPWAKILFHHPWGDMGRDGYKGNDKRVRNIDCGNSIGLPRLSGHSALFAPGNIGPWAAYIRDQINDYTKRINGTPEENRRDISIRSPRNYI